MKKFVFNTLKLSLLIMMYFSSCYNNKEDITILPKVSFLGCSVVEGIFKAGMWWAFILIFGVVFLVGWLYLKARKK